MIHPLPIATVIIEDNVSTILPCEAQIPITCDQCEADTNVSIADLKALAPITCQHCRARRAFTQTELEITRLVLAQAGYYFS